MTPAEVEVVVATSAPAPVPEVGEAALTTPRDSGAVDVPTSARPPTTAAVSTPPPGARDTSGEGGREDGGTAATAEDADLNLFTGLGASGAADLHTTSIF